MPPKDITIRVSRASEDDALPLAQIEAVAFDDPNTEEPSDVLGRVMFGPPTESGQSFRAQELIQRMRTMPEVRLYKAVAFDKEKGEQDGKVVGFGGWRFYTDPFPEQDTWEDKPWEFARNPQACNEFFGRLARAKTKYMGGKRFAWLEILAVHPDYQGLGVGKKLIQAGLDDAAELALDKAYLEATEAGYPLYKKFGWKDVDEVIVDLTKYGGKGSWPTACMSREG
ncbi:hypothetical protein PISL3812_07490 [Talaromyces islandicus]|uniref:N-acetyltransferase domain-containing protein n=1 Tax=Talaromyces islandicus TaxID=28573 RepID=A0A0U1M689_TALIS|nr:hypothetical protein PISL3812_07490 [Talaromyces islandicus]